MTGGTGTGLCAQGTSHSASTLHLKCSQMLFVKSPEPGTARKGTVSHSMKYLREHHLNTQIIFSFPYASTTVLAYIFRTNLFFCEQKVHPVKALNAVISGS